MVSTIDEAKTPAELAEWLRNWAKTYEDGDMLDDNDARQLADAVERVCTLRYWNAHVRMARRRNVRKRPVAPTLAPVCFARWLFAPAEKVQEGGAE